MPRRLITVLIAAITLLALSVPALAKEGAVTKFDSLPTDWHAGQTYALGYTIRMDGTQPYQADRTEIIANSLDGKTSLVFPGVTDKSSPGHYTANVMFPAAGTYRWKVTQGSFFPAYDLGTLSVLPAVASTGNAPAPVAPVSDRLGEAIPFAAIGAGLFATFVLARNRRRQVTSTA
jgi:hypothetical protein